MDLGENMRNDFPNLLRNFCSYNVMCEAADHIERMETRLAEDERDAARYRWVHDNIDWVDDVGYVLTLHPDANGVAMFQWGVDAAMGEE